MTEALVLDAEQAEKVRGLSPSKDGAVLAPRSLKDGRFILGPEVLDDPAHEDVWDFLASLPREPLEKLPIYTEDDALRGEPIPDDGPRLVARRLPGHSLDEAKPDALAAIDVDGEPRKPA